MGDPPNLFWPVIAAEVVLAAGLVVLFTAKSPKRFGRAKPPPNLNAMVGYVPPYPRYF